MPRLRCLVTATWLLLVGGCTLLHKPEEQAPEKGARGQLSIGYSLLYQEADGIPKLKWLIRFKDKREEMSQVTDELVSFYEKLATSMENLSKKYPAMRIHVKPMSDIEAEERKAIGSSLAKDLAPVVGRSGVAFEREALLTFYDSLNEQRHLVRVMLERETVPALKDFLETTRFELDSRYSKVGTLLNERYFVH